MQLRFKINVIKGQIYKLLKVYMFKSWFFKGLTVVVYCDFTRMHKANIFMFFEEILDNKILLF